MQEKITSFSGKYRWLSNFFPVSICYDGIVYPSVEHAFQAAKSLDPSYRLMISECKTPAEAKILGRRVALRPDWEACKVKIMHQLLKLKFETPGLKLRLSQTWPADLEEWNNWGDTFWGIYKGKGRNMLGKLLMIIRDDNGDSSLIDML